LSASGIRRLAGGFIATLLAMAGFALFAGGASAQATTWLCKPGIDDNPCLGTLGGVSMQPGNQSVDLQFELAARPPVDCFYLYPTQSAQTTANADFARDDELKSVAINQARMFSRLCDVYAPVYRQYTFRAPVTDEVRDIAYDTAVDGWNDYLKNYNRGRGVILVGHSQGTSHLARLIAEKIDGNAKLHSRVISAILPGANVYVPKGEVVGGQFQNIPACEAGDQVGCVIAYHMMKSAPPADGSFGRMDSGYWINPEPRPDPAQYEALCVNPAELSGDNGILRPLANLLAFVGNPEGAKPWQAMPDFYSAECKSNDLASWLEVTDIRQPGDNRQDLTTLIQRGPNNDLHLGDINLALENLVQVAASQTRVWAATERAALQSRVRMNSTRSNRLRTKVRTLRKQRAALVKKCRKGSRPACVSARRKKITLEASEGDIEILAKATRDLRKRIAGLAVPQV
jgi:hypothetical protein